LLTTRGTEMIGKLLKMQLLEDDMELAYGSEEKMETKMEKERRSLPSPDVRPQWMKILHQSAVNWLQTMPKQLQMLKRTAENIKDPMYRYFEREVNSGARLLNDVRKDLDDVVQICDSNKKQTNYHRAMLSDLVKGIIPSTWKRYTIPLRSTVIQWIMDFSLRIKQLQEVSELVAKGGANALKSFPVWLGGLFNPEAYITATRQCIAQANSWSLEELDLEVAVYEKETARGLEQDGFIIRGLKLQGANCQLNKLNLTTAVLTDLPITKIKWIKGTHSAEGDQPKSSTEITLPVYLNATRNELLFTVNLETESVQDRQSFYERGVALLASTTLN